jgi:O-antigen/teichoic acid export membrane protein
MNEGTPTPPDPQAPSLKPSSLELEGRILRNTGWVAVSLGARQVGSILALIVLARILEPRDLGLVALAWTVLSFIGQIQETGLGSALIHRRTDIEAAAATVLIYAPLLSALGYIAVFAVSPLAARFFHAPDLVDVLRVMGLVLVLRGLGVVPGAILERSLDFRSRTIAEVVATFMQIGVFLGLAVAGLGVWSLVIGNLVSQGTQTMLYWLLVAWRPSPRRWSRTILLELIQYGRFIGAANVLSVLNNTVDNIVVGRMLGAFSVGLYSLAFRLADFPVTVIGFVLGRPMFSVFSLLQDDLDAFRHAYVRNLQRIALLSLPASLGLMIAAKPIVATLLGDKWLGAVPALQILAVYGLIKPFAGVAASALNGLGKPHLNLFFGVTYVVVVFPALVLLTPRFGLEGAATSMLIAISVIALPALTVAARELKLSGSEMARALAPCAISSALMAATLAALLPQTDSMGPGSSLALLVAAGLFVYFVATALFARSIVTPMWLSLREGRE